MDFCFLSPFSWAATLLIISSVISQFGKCSFPEPKVTSSTVLLDPQPQTQKIQQKNPKTKQTNSYFQSYCICEK